jgi:diguanylate cyclase (GGDEF)-like protein/PAS domain S-box-containing protein
MIRAAQRFADGDLAHVIRHDARDEIGGLADALNRMARTLWKSGRLLAKAQEMSGVGGWEYEVRDDRFVWSAQAASVLGVAYEALPVTRDALHAYIHPDDLPWVSRLLDADYAGNPVFRHEFRVLRSNGEQRTLRVVGEASLGDDGRLLRMIGAFQDVSEHKQAEAQLVYLASYDTLTGLPNRSLFIDRLAHGLRQADRQQGRLALLFLDLDRFKEINDTLGHAAGDDLLRQAAERLKRVVRETDTVARLGGDEFTVVLEGLPSGEEAAGIAQKILDTLACPFRLGTHEVFVSASIGITVYPGDADGIDSLLKNADRAMYLAKAEGRNTYRYFTVEMNSRAHERLALETALRGALGRGEFVLHYQPQVDVRSGDLVGFEALLRWQRGAQRVPPAEFVPVLEDTGLIVEVGAWVIEEACRWLAAWNTTYGVAASVAVNVSGRQFRDSGLLATVSRALRESGIAAAQLELEITESCLVDEARSLDLIHALSGLGVRLAIDDFGTGYSSLAYLKRLPVEKLKIDRSFVHDISDDHEAAAIVAAILALAHTLQLRVVAEGVETVEQLAYLRHHDCDEIQGYLIAPPLAPSDLAAWRGALTSTLTGHARVVPLRVWRD